MTIHLAAIDIKRLVEEYPNDQELGRTVREMYINDRKGQQVFLEDTVYPVSNKHYLSKTLLEMGENPRATVNNRRHDATTLKSQEDIDNETDQEEESLYEDFHTFPEIQLELKLNKD